jgi:hypothetical protein
MYLCDESAKEGDEHFFGALIKLGVLGDVLKIPSDYYKDFAATALENGHKELAERITTSSRYSGNFSQTVKLIFGYLLI